MNALTDLPPIALSIRQPWAWLIVNGHKDIENRTWVTGFRGRFLVHASKGMTRDEYLDGLLMASENGIELPLFDDLPRGGIVGAVDLVGLADRETRPTSPWFVGPVGFQLAGAVSLPFVPCKGALGFFKPELPHAL